MIKEKLKSKDFVISLLTILFVFAVLIIFFCNVHPMYVYQLDDWVYISYNRIGIPSTHYFNPTKILPEVLLPASAEIAVDIVYPITGDYIGSMAKVFGIVLSLFTTILMGYVAGWLKKHYGLSAGIISGLVIVVLLMFFMPYYNLKFSFSSMFYASNTNAIFNYVVPGLFNAILVFVLFEIEKFEWFNRKKIYANGILLLFIYLCINSNLFHSIIGAAFVGSILVEKLYIQIRNSEKKGFIKFVSEYVKDNYTYLLILLMWFCSAILEACGDRAVAGGTEIKIKETWAIYINSILGMNKLFLLLVFGSLFVAWVIWIYRAVKRNEKDHSFISYQWKTLFSLLLTFIFDFLLCARVSPASAQNCAALWAVPFFEILIFIVSTGYIMKNVPQFFIGVPIALFVLSSVFVVTKENYRDVYYTPIIKDICNDIIDQIVEADQKGETYCEVYIPISHNPELPENTVKCNEVIARAAYFHGLTTKYMDVKIIETLEKNEEFNFPVYKE
ncbi:MAG: hypothetical protein MJ107_01025 [Lachnospiraceae bacterium]|nr:hypothetical protein [Lachnospiraceae bacterium]